MTFRKMMRTCLTMCLIAVLAVGGLNTTAYAKEKSYSEISENTSDDTYNIILLGGGGDNRVFVNGEAFGKVNEANIRSVIDEDKINILAGHSTGANQIELFIKSGALEDVVDMYVIIDGSAYFKDVRYCGGDSEHPILIFMSDQMNKMNAYYMRNQYSNYEIHFMHGTKHVNLATEHYLEVVDIIHSYYERTSMLCGSCDYIYEPEAGNPDNGVPEGTEFDDVPDDWCCPECGANKNEFVRWKSRDFIHEIESTSA